MPRVNRAIELLEQRQPIYYTNAPDRSYEGGKQAASTWADYINYEMEHSPFDLARLADFMLGLVDGGPTRSGHRTPTVIVTVPTDGSDEQVVRSNAWMFKQALATGIHGILLCHAETPSHLFRRESLFLEFNELLIAIRSLRMAGKVSTPCKRVWVLRLAWKRWCLFRLFLFLQF